MRIEKNRISSTQSAKRKTYSNNTCNHSITMNTIFLLGKYTSKILQRFHIQDCNPMYTHLDTNQRKEDSSTREVVDRTIYKQLVGSLMYMVNRRPNICLAISQLSQFMMEPTKLHQRETKYVLIYLKGIVDYGLWYKRIDGVKLQGFTNVYWARSPLDKKSTSRAIFSVGSTIVSWYSIKQRYVALK